MTCGSTSRKGRGVSNYRVCGPALLVVGLSAFKRERTADQADGRYALLTRHARPRRDEGRPESRDPHFLRVDGGDALEGGKGLDGFSGSRLGDAQDVETLQIDPATSGSHNLRRRSKG